MGIAPHLTTTKFLLALLIVMAATIVQINIGMGFGMTAGPLMALLDTAFVPLTVLCLSSISAIMGTIITHRDIIWRDLGFAFFGRFIGSIIAIAILLQLPDEKSFMLAFGLLIAFGVALSISGMRFPFNTKTLFTAGGVSGLMGTITSVGAPPLALIYQNQAPQSSRATLSSYFALGCVLSIIILMLAGLGTWREILVGIMLAPAAFLGVAVAKPLRPFVDKRYQIFLQSIAGIAAITLIWRGLGF